LSDKLRREPTVKELSNYTNFDERKVGRLVRRDRAIMPESSLVPEDGEDDDEEYLPGVKSDDPYAIWADYVYHDLSDIDRLIFQHRLGYRGAEVLPNSEIAQRVNLSPAAVSKRVGRIQERLDEMVEL